MKTLLERRAAAAAEIRRLADLVNDKEHAWSADDEAAWKKANEEFDLVTGQLERSERARQVGQVLDEPAGDDPARGHGILEDRSYRAEARKAALDDDDGEDGRQTFRTEDGCELRTLSATDQLCRGRYAQAGAVGRLLSGLVLGRLHEVPEAERREALGGLDSSGGFMLAPSVSAGVLDLARSASVCIEGGARTAKLEAPEVHLVKVSEDPTAAWRAEGVNVAASSFAFERITLRPRTCAVILPVSYEILEDVPNLARTLEDLLRTKMGQELDRVCVKGKGSESEPLGILSAAGVNTIGSVGTPADWTDISGAVKELLTDNYAGPLERLTWAAHPRDAATYDSLVDATTGQPLQPLPWAARVRRAISTVLPIDGGAGAEGSMIVGDFGQLLIGLRGNVNLRVVDGSATEGTKTLGVANLVRLIVCYMRVDCALLRPEHFCTLTGVTIT